MRMDSFSPGWRARYAATVDDVEGPDGADLQLALVQLAGVAQEELGLGLQRDQLLRQRQQLLARARQ